MHALTREAVASFPQLTDRAPLALVVDALLMRAADDAIGHGDRQRELNRETEEAKRRSIGADAANGADALYAGPTSK